MFFDPTTHDIPGWYFEDQYYYYDLLYRYPTFKISKTSKHGKYKNILSETSVILLINYSTQEHEQENQYRQLHTRTNLI